MTIKNVFKTTGNVVKGTMGLVVDGAIGMAAAGAFYGTATGAVAGVEAALNSGVEEKTSKFRKKTYYVNADTGKKIKGYQPKKVIPDKYKDGCALGLSAASLAVGGVSGKTFHDMRKKSNSDVNVYFGSDFEDLTPEDVEND